VEFIVKPFPPQQLTASISNLLQNKIPPGQEAKWEIPSSKNTYQKTMVIIQDIRILLNLSLPELHLGGSISAIELPFFKAKNPTV